MQPCLGDETIAALLEGRLAGAHGDATRAHLAGCVECRRLVAATVAALPAASTAALPARGSAPAGSGQREPLAPGTLFAGRYRIEHALGQGGMGHLFVARQLGLDRLVAIKLLQPELARDPLALQRFQREAKLVAALHSEHVVRVHDFGEGPGGEPYLVMELLEGEDLAAVVARGPVEPARAMAWIRAATVAVAEAHAQGIVHRDLKPSNLFLTRGGKIKVLDFGLAKLVPAALPTGVQPGTDAGVMTHTGMILGSPHYMAPEQILGAHHADARSDVWSLGATLFHLLRGFPPFAQNTLDSVFASILSGWLPPLEGVPPPLAAIIRRAMAQDPAARFASAAELLHALDGVAPAAMQTAPASPLSPSTIPGRRVATPVALAGAALALAAAAVMLAWPSQARPLATEQQPSREPASPTPELTTDSAGSSGNPERPAPKTGAVPDALDNLDEARLHRRLENLGWKTTTTTREAFPGCQHTRLGIEHQSAPSEPHQAQTADVFLLDCTSSAMAASELARLRRGFPLAWFSLAGARLLMVARDEERLSRALAEALLEP